MHQDYSRHGRPSTSDLVAGYAELIERYVRDGWRPFLLTWMFRKLRGDSAAMTAQAMDEVQRTYSTFATRVVRDPNRNIGGLPLLVAAPDYPVAKRGKLQLREVTINDGIHANGVLVVPLQTRLKLPVVEHFVHNHGRLYAHAGSALERLDVRPIERTAGVAVHYALKWFERGRVSSDELLILPRVRSELR